ncbi:MAG TPA: MauE/DoxX family redox-associated membrane protein [Vicinamibacteria bacterium]|nr:MauE/DoxX family redox-associated membrane protein [Vicinamibacteria bacterium]
MMALLRGRAVQLLLRLLLGGFFVYASIDKILAPAAFARVIYQWQVTGPLLSNLGAVTLPWVELLAGALLVLGVWKRECALVIALLLCVFLGAAATVLARGIDVENCGCTSLARSEATSSGWPPSWARGVGWFLVSRDLLMLGAALVIASGAERRAAPERDAATPAA